MSLAFTLLGLLPFQTIAEPVSVIARSFGAFDGDGEIGAAGPGYVAGFAEGRVEFTPVFGERAPRRFPVSFALESIRRGDRAILESPPPAPPVREGNFVRYARPGGIVESYESRVDGVEQTFLFPSRPEGAGDLVVRGTVTTELPASGGEGAADGIRFEMPALGGVTWGAVTGIDAEGSTAGGDLRFDGTHLEMTLPASFVDRAAYPLLLDPLIGSTVLLGGGPDDRDPDAAYDETNDLYLVVWERTISPGDRDVLGQRFLAAGNLVGSTIAIGTGTGDHRNPAVANVNASDRFLVVYENSGAIGARTVDADDGLASGSLMLGSGANPDVGGASMGSTEAILVWRASPSGIVAKRVSVPPTGAIQTLPETPVSSNPSDYGVTISQHCGNPCRFLVVWRRPDASGGYDVYARVIEPTGLGNFLTWETTVSADAVADETNAVCATEDGTRFAIAYEKHNGGAGTISDIACRTAEYSPAAGSLAVSGETILAGQFTLDQVDPAIDFAGSKYLVAWSSASLFGSGFNVYMTAIAPDGCVPCEPVVTLDSSSATADRYPRIAAKHSGSMAAGDEALVVWESVGTTGDVKLQRVEAIGAGGAVTPLGGGCGGGGTAWVNGPAAVGNADFAFTLQGAAGPPVAFALGASTLNVACGGCTLVPPLGFLLSGPAPVPLGIPCDLSLVGGTVYGQWIVLAPGSCSLAPALSLSDACGAVIGY